ncbi:response regulator [Pseudodesulfovibrio piezophilus]|uniref:Transcriptional regulatory protein ompR n=1 Tax=Pseudodesulfovibrio piezophilus (strain DSM 21447 / JCM 15486 / C1TLV30) TaxID=1322246 RepID=M1WY77_PSEP2|nr:response regulator transcription factor [Pseudodesulfovibrio piezophilus]CCH50188.1 Transcriptional regulatory protein ompR [Pseudodesulfovibrio piezophilus C1TLV30]
MDNNGAILIIDDDDELRELITEYLTGYGFKVLTLPSGEKVVETVTAEKPCLVILDIMMPGKDGLQVLGELRTVSSVPVIMLTAKGEDTDRIVGLELGADDYMPKPFNPRELLARIKAILRRYEIIASENGTRHSTRLIECGGLSLNTARQVVTVEEDELELSATEYRLLKVFMNNPDTAMTRDELMNLVWDKDFSAFDRSIDVHVHKLRSLLKPYEAHASRIKTVWGTGYMFLGAS